MRIGLVTDTHIPDVARALPPELLQLFKGVDLILHAGDIYSLSVLDDLENIAPVKAARGDDDLLSTLNDPRVKEKHVLSLCGKIVWLAHDPPYYLSKYWLPKVPNADDAPTGSERPDIVVFGHEHTVTVREHNGILFVNSGSATFLRYSYGKGTAGILEIDSGEARANVVQL
ncbi:MAG: metallophosphoesterase family protein [Chloroflexi bacterium]|nr:metallophosphoesterase family protein [Chloroflexota bacterium]